MRRARARAKAKARPIKIASNSIVNECDSIDGKLQQRLKHALIASVLESWETKNESLWLQLIGSGAYHYYPGVSMMYSTTADQYARRSGQWP